MLDTIGLLICAVALGAASYVALSNSAHDNEVAEDKTQRLEIADRYKSHFPASASHDLRQRLHALNLFVAQLQSETDPAGRNGLIGHIDAAVGSMNDLFEALLDMTKLDAGILKPDRTTFCIKRLLGASKRHSQLPRARRDCACVWLGARRGC
jgi:signal transduction histidine kinase